MSYLLNKSDGSLLIELLDGVADGPQVNDSTAHTSINLIGKNYPGYGELQNENFLHLLENFSSATAPTHPIRGQLWHDLNVGRLKIYNGTSFVLVTTAAFTSGSSAPSGPDLGDQWWDTVNDQFKIYNGSVWVVVGPLYSKLLGKSGALVETISDGAINHTVIKLYSNNNLMGIISYDNAFTPSPSITGFSIIKPGINLSTVNSGQYNGTATNATQLGGVTSSSYARKDLSSVETFSGNIALSGGTASVAFNPITFATQITNTQISGDLDLITNKAGILTKSLHIDGVTGEVQVAISPTTNMGVVNKSYLDLRLSTSLTGYAPINSPSLTGVPTSVTPSLGDITNKIATTSFVNTAIKNSKDALWQGSQKFISPATPEPTSGLVGDFWFQII